MIDWRRYIPNANISNAVATLISAIATALLVAVGIWGVCETKKTLELSERAWLSPIGGQVMLPPKINEALHFSIGILNSGREPATDLHFRFQNFVINAFDPTFTDLANVQVPENTSCENLFPEEHRAIGPPNIVFNFVYDTVRGDPAMFVTDAILNGSQFLVLDGCVAYNTFGKMHRTSFCYIVESASIAASTAALAESNSSGANSPPATPQTTGLNVSNGRVFTLATCASGFDLD